LRDARGGAGIHPLDAAIQVADELHRHGRPQTAAQLLELVAEWWGGSGASAGGPGRPRAGQLRLRLGRAGDADSVAAARARAPGAGFEAMADAAVAAMFNGDTRRARLLADSAHAHLPPYAFGAERLLEARLHARAGDSRAAARELAAALDG